MKIIKKTETTKEIRATCTIINYSFKNEKIDLAIAEIKGRYPETGYCLNEHCDEVFYITSGNVTLTHKGIA